MDALHGIDFVRAGATPGLASGLSVVMAALVASETAEIRPTLPPGVTAARMVRPDEKRPARVESATEAPHAPSHHRVDRRA